MVSWAPPIDEIQKVFYVLFLSITTRELMRDWTDSSKYNTDVLFGSWNSFIAVKLITEQEEEVEHESATYSISNM